MDEQNMLATREPSQWYRLLLVTGIILAAVNLRPAITSVGPLLGMIRDDIGLANWSVGLLTSLPLIAFAVMSPLVPRIARVLTKEYALVVGLALLILGITIRSITFTVFLFGGTLLAGLGITFCNVLLPGVIKEKFPLKVALMTSIYSTVMTMLAAVASGVSIPLAKGLNLGWNAAMVVWVIPAVLGIVIWIYLGVKNKKQQQATLDGTTSKEGEKKHNIWSSPLAWQVAFYMGFQSCWFYITISWLPEILYAYGVDMATAGWMLSFAQFIGVPFSFIIPVIAEKFKSQRGIIVVLGLLGIGGYCGLLFGSSYLTMVVSIIAIGIPLGGNFALALAFLGMRAENAEQASDLSGMAQSLGYVLAAIGPLLIGYLFDVTQVWDVPLMTLIIIAVLYSVFGLGAGRNKHVFD
ncbi:CynX/NimT family MFS transporter [Lentibacillus salinarum]|uniref:CynX/NimT family MFS transporter n=1 Tax=Lentibacillus salinarum TaxID=446820 RepID=A0ABW3ZUF9_9BACI